MTDIQKQLEETIKSCVCRECGGILMIMKLDEDEIACTVCCTCHKSHMAVKPEIYEMAREYDLRYYGYDIINDDEHRKRAILVRCAILSSGL